MPARSLNTKMDMDVKNYSKNMSQITTETKNFKKELELWATQNKKTSSSTEYLSQKLKMQKGEQSNLGRQIDITQKKLAEQAQKFGQSSIQAERLKGKLLDLQIQQSKLNKEIKENNPIGNMLKNYSSAMSTMGTKLRSLGSTMTYSATLPILALGGGMANLAMNAGESENLFEKSMGKNADNAREWSMKLQNDLKLNGYELRKNIGLYQTLGTSMGIPEQAALDMGKNITELGYDMASFFNVSNSQALDDLKAIWNGQTEPLEKYGVSIRERTIEQWALSKGLIKQGQELSEQQKIFARYNLVLAATKNAQGDLADTIDSPSNKFRILKERITLLGIEIGNKLIPQVEKGLSVGNSVLDWFVELNPKTQETIILFAGLTAVAGPLTAAIGALAGILGFLATPAGAAVLAVGGITAALVHLYNTDAQARTDMQNGWNNFAVGFTKASVKVAEGIFAIRDAWNNMPMWDPYEPLRKNLQHDFVNPFPNAKRTNLGERNINWYSTWEQYAFQKEQEAYFGKEDDNTYKINVEDIWKDLDKVGEKGTTEFDKLKKASEDFTKSIEQQSESFANFGNMFDRTVSERFSPAKIQSRLNRFVQMIQQWQQNLIGLEKRGVGADVIANLRSMGVAGSGLVAGFTKMSDQELVSTVNTIGKVRGIADTEAYKATDYKHQHSGEITVKGVNNEGELVGSTKILADNFGGLKNQDLYSVTGSQRRESGR